MTAESSKYLLISFLLALLAGNVQGLSVAWRSGSPNPKNPFICAPCDAKANQYVAGVTCHDSKIHTYEITCTVSWPGGSATGNASYQTADDFQVYCTWTGFEPGHEYRMKLVVEETDTGQTAQTGDFVIDVIKVISIGGDIAYDNTDEEKVVGSVALTVAPAVTAEAPVSISSSDAKAAAFYPSCENAYGPPTRVTSGQNIAIAIHKPEGYVHFPDPSKLTYPVTLTAQCDGSCATCKVNVNNIPPLISPVGTVTIPRCFTLVPFSVSGTRSFSDP